MPCSVAGPSPPLEGWTEPLWAVGSTTAGNVNAGSMDDRFNLEPHLSGGGQFGGSTSPELFLVAVNALNKVLAQAGS